MMTFLYAVIGLLVVGLAVYGRWLNSPELKGKLGEASVHNLLLQLPAEYHLLDDVVLWTKWGTTQIDHIVVSRYGVFAIETKNFRGKICGDDERKEWTQIITTDVTYRRKWYKTYTYVTKSHFYNPVKQAWGHVYEIRNLLVEWPHLPVIPVVVFVGNASLNMVSTRNHVVHECDLLPTILNYSNVCLMDAEVLKVENRLMECNVRDEVSNATHVRNVRAARMNYETKLSAGICPKCGGKLVERTGKFGRFYGCSNYPRCKFTTQ